MAPFPIRVTFLGTLATAVLAVWGCSTGADSALSGLCTGDCSCSGSVCVCEPGGTCRLGAALVATDAGPDSAPSDAGRLDAGPPPPNGVTFHCDSDNHCDLTCGTECTSTCAGQSVCTGTCGSDCTSRCEGGSRCTLDAGARASVTCGGHSECSVTLGASSVMKCQGNSNCHAVCPEGGCVAECTGSSTCTVECGGLASCSIECNGQRTENCAAGTTCTNVCGGEAPPDGGSPAAHRG